MPVKSTASTPTTPRKRRTRKTNTRTAKAVAKTDKVIKEIQAVLDAPRETSKVKVTKVKAIKQDAKIRSLKSVKRPSTARLISPQKYLKDISTRWAIHNFEIQELLKDFKSGFKAVQPYHAEAVKTVKAWTV